MNQNRKICDRESRTQLLFNLALAIAATLLLPYASPVQAAYWYSSQTMLGTRYLHGSATGPDGKVYVIGGRRGTQYLNSVEQFNPPTNSAWAAVAGMALARSYHAVVTGIDGFIYAIGGDTLSGPTVKVERFDTATATWSTVAPLNTPRERLAAAVGPNGRIYAMGGANVPAGVFALNTVEVYDAATNTWSSAPSMVKPRRHHTAVTGLDGNIYVFGGDVSGAPTWERFDGTVWALLGTLNFTATGYATATGPDGVMYSVAASNGSPLTGWSGVNAYLSGGPASPFLNMNNSRNQAAVAVAEGKLFVTGGRTAAVGELNDLEGYYGPLHAPLFPGATAWWRFEEANGAAVADAAGPHPGTVVNGATHFVGRVGNSMAFNGANQYIQVADSPTLKLPDNLTIEGWIKWTPNTFGLSTIVDKRVANLAGIYGYHLFVMPAGNLGFQLANGTSHNYIAPNPLIPANKWTHVAVTVSKTSSNPSLMLYVNGVRALTTTPVSGNIASSAPLLIGWHSLSAPSYPFKGYMDELTIYTRPLLWAQVRAIFLAGREGKQ